MLLLLKRARLFVRARSVKINAVTRTNKRVRFFSLSASCSPTLPTYAHFGMNKELQA